MHSFGQTQHLLDLLFPLYNMLYFAWPPFLVMLLRRRRPLMARLITLWTVSGVLSIALVLMGLDLASPLPQVSPEPYNTIIIVSLRLAILVLLASRLVQPKVTFQHS